MTHIKVLYDAETRTFRLVDQQNRTLLDGDALYDLEIPLWFEEVEDASDVIPAGSC